MATLSEGVRGNSVPQVYDIVLWEWQRMTHDGTRYPYHVVDNGILYKRVGHDTEVIKKFYIVVPYFFPKRSWVEPLKYKSVIF